MEKQEETIADFPTLDFHQEVTNAFSVNALAEIINEQILDDGGHSNDQQISTTINTIPNINDDGLLVIEDTHTSYMQQFGNPHKYSFINFSKKIIDEINFKFFKSKNEEYF